MIDLIILTVGDVRQRTPLYEVRMDPQMDEDMGKLAERLSENRAEVFRRAMRLYVAVKNRQLDHQSHLFLEDAQDNRTEITGV